MYLARIYHARAATAAPLHGIASAIRSRNLSNFDKSKLSQTNGGRGIKVPEIRKIKPISPSFGVAEKEKAPSKENVNTKTVTEEPNFAYNAKETKQSKQSKHSKSEPPPIFPDELLPESISGWSGTSQDFKKLVCYEDAHVLIVYKPSGILSVPVTDEKIAKQSFYKSIRDMASEYVSRQNQNDWHIFQLNRIDTIAAGLVVFSKSKQANKSLQKQFELHRVKKNYFAVVNNSVFNEEICQNYLKTRQLKTTEVITIEQYNKLDEKTQKLYEFAELSYKPIHSFTSPDKTTRQTLLDVSLKTGRKHQIRAQLSSRNFPILGDFKYGATQTFRNLKDICLYNYGIGLIHPIYTKQKITVSIDCPKIWKQRFPIEVTKAIQGKVNFYRARIIGIMNEEEKARKEVVKLERLDFKNQKRARRQQRHNNNNNSHNNNEENDDNNNNPLTNVINFDNLPKRINNPNYDGLVKKK